MTPQEVESKVKITMLAEAELGKIENSARQVKLRKDDNVTWAYLKDLIKISDEENFLALVAVIGAMLQSNYLDVVEMGYKFNDILSESTT